MVKNNEFNVFVAKIRSSFKDYMEASIPANVVRKYNIRPEEELEIKIKDSEATANTRRSTSGNDYSLTISIPPKYSNHVEKGDLVEIFFKKKEEIKE